MTLLLAIFLLLSLILEGTLISLPLVPLILLIALIKSRSTWVFILAILLGILLDSFAFRNLGSTSIFLLFFLFSVLIYERKFEINNLFFITVSSFIGSMVFLWLFDNNMVLLKATISSVFAILLSKVFLQEKRELW